MSISDHATLKAKYKEHRNKRKSISACEADFRKWEREKQLGTVNVKFFVLDV